MPVTFSVPAQQRQGTFLSPAVTQAGFTLLHYELLITKVAEYEAAANSVTSSVLVTPPGGAQFVYGTSTWTGGRTTDKTGAVDPVPVVEFGIDPAQVPDGSTLLLQIVVPNRMTVGVQNGSLG